MPQLPLGIIYRLEAYFFKNIRKHPDWPVLISEGDSWFSLDTRGNTIDQLPNAGPFSLLRLEQSGDELLAILAGGQRGELKRLIGLYPVNALLFSAGGNDIITPDFDQLLNPYEEGMTAGDCLNAAALSNRLDQLEAGYRDVVGILAAFSGLPGKKRRDVRLLVHGYDYAIPSNRPVKYLFIKVAGPWMHKHFQTRRIPSELRRPVVRLMMDGFNQRLHGLSVEFPGRFLHLDTRNTLADDEWGDEIHPTRRGYVKIAERFRLELARLFPGFFTQALKP